MAAAGAVAEDGGVDEVAVREQDKFLPIANISRIMKEALPNNAKVSKDAKELVQNCVSDFIIYITSQASDKCQREKRKTVNGDDILWAMQSLGFDDAVTVLTTYLAKIREAEGDEKSAKGGAPAKDSPSSMAVPTTVPEGAGGDAAGQSAAQLQGMPQQGYHMGYPPMQMGQMGGQNMQPQMMMYHQGMQHKMQQQQGMQPPQMQIPSQGNAPPQQLQHQQQGGQPPQ